jgi:hypothetical protein
MGIERFGLEVRQQEGEANGGYQKVLQRNPCWFRMMVNRMLIDRYYHKKYEKDVEMIRRLR